MQGRMLPGQTSQQSAPPVPLISLRS
jgi:hypothetical protein